MNTSSHPDPQFQSVMGPIKASKTDLFHKMDFKIMVKWYQNAKCSHCVIQHSASAHAISATQPHPSCNKSDKVLNYVLAVMITLLDNVHVTSSITTLMQL